MIKIADHPVGDGNPVYIIGEIGINHNGDINIAKKLIDVAVSAGCNAVKFQKRTPELCVPKDQRNILRETPWGMMTYIDYKYRLEFGEKEYKEIDIYCKRKGIHWFTSCWSNPDVEFIKKFNPICFKVASACLTNDNLIMAAKSLGCPIILSTGMSTMPEIRHAASLMGKDNYLIAHSTSSYPCAPEELNLRMIKTLKREFNVTVGYSGHEVGLQTTAAAVVLGASFIERHITLDRSMWGTDQSASIEPAGLHRLVRDIRVIEKALGDGVKRVYESEKGPMTRLRNIDT